MKKSRFTEEQVIYALRLAESGTLVTDVCHQPAPSLAITAASSKLDESGKRKFRSILVSNVDCLNDDAVILASTDGNHSWLCPRVDKAAYGHNLFIHARKLPGHGVITTRHQHGQAGTRHCLPISLVCRVNRFVFELVPKVASERDLASYDKCLLCQQGIHLHPLWVNGNATAGKHQQGKANDPRNVRPS
ncbi:MAG TPA: hypothetical protein VM621_11820 [Luteibacter sp.]|uniref:hypothetical protein n=1 Tax=Luteibacter sp. TaxID=1886636 RepID=UPI002CAEF6C6|nr:hypothetical protein [Luteibacter sp.]HVI55721.1 hypothetical protein [Luteibacter sp.]